MNANRRWRLYAALTAVALLGFTCWSWTRLAAAREAAARATDDLAACRQLAERVRTLSSQPSLAGAREWAPTELARRIERAAREARMEPSCVVRISPEDARKIGDGTYREQPTQLQLRQVTLSQVAVFLHTLTAAGDGGGLRVSSLRLSAPRGREADAAAGGGNRWSAEATLTYLIFDPSNTIRKGT